MDKCGTQSPKLAFAQLTTHGTVTSVKDILFVLETEFTTENMIDVSALKDNSGTVQSVNQDLIAAVARSSMKPALNVIALKDSISMETNVFSV